MIATDQCTLAGRIYTATVLLPAVARIDDVLGNLDGGHNFRVAIGFLHIYIAYLGYRPLWRYGCVLYFTVGGAVTSPRGFCV